MSLQALDTTSDIPDAYKLALSESRRWYSSLISQPANYFSRLVLAYTSRSTLGLRAQGMGLPDLRKQLEEEEEVLFGFLRFRRKGIVLQFTHPDCSRVVKGTAQFCSQRSSSKRGPKFIFRPFSTSFATTISSSKHPPRKILL
jgi:hypothetical protein